MESIDDLTNRIWEKARTYKDESPLVLYCSEPMMGYSESLNIRNAQVLAGTYPEGMWVAYAQDARPTEQALDRNALREYLGSLGTDELQDIINAMERRRYHDRA